jgi:ATP-dependent protease ClpP protease subunit
MAKEILLYGSIYTFSAVDFINAMEEAKGEEVQVRINTPGGSPEDTWGIVAKLGEHDGGLKIKVDGRAHSAGAFALCYGEYVEALDVSEFLFHRAAYSKWFETSENMTSEMWANLDRINKSLRKAMENKIDVAKFEKISGVTLDELFSNDTRKDVFLSAKQAKQIGLIDKITTITPAKKKEINALALGIAAQSGIGAMTFDEEVERPEIKKPETKITTKMGLEEFKAKHPEVFAQAVAQGVEQERERVGAWMVYVDIDAEAVAKGIDEGKNISPKTMAELNRKQFSQESLAKIESENTEEVKTETPKEGKGAEGEDKVAEGTNAVLAHLGINQKKS